MLRGVQDQAQGRIACELDKLIQQSIAESRSLTLELSPPALYDGGLGSA